MVPLNCPTLKQGPCLFFTLVSKSLVIGYIEVEGEHNSLDYFFSKQFPSAEGNIQEKRQLQAASSQHSQQLRDGGRALKGELSRATAMPAGHIQIHNPGLTCSHIDRQRLNIVPIAFKTRICKRDAQLAYQSNGGLKLQFSIYVDQQKHLLCNLWIKTTVCSALIESTFYTCLKYFYNFNIQ